MNSHAKGRPISLAGIGSPLSIISRRVMEQCQALFALDDIILREVQAQRMNGTAPVDVGTNLRQLREERNISMRTLAKNSGLSANALSMIERGKSSPSVSTLYKLADALDVPVTAFFGAPVEKEQVIHLRAIDRPRLPILRGAWEGLGGEKFTGRVEPFVLTLETGADSGPAPLVHTGHEFVFCLTGDLEYRVEERYFLLAPGDSLLFAAHLRHHWRNAGQGPVHVLIVLSGFSESDHPLATHIPKEKGGGRG